MDVHTSHRFQLTAALAAALLALVLAARARAQDSAFADDAAYNAQALADSANVPGEEPAPEGDLDAQPAADDTADTNAPSSTGMRGYATVGLGSTARKVSYASNAGDRGLDTGFVAAVEVRVGAEGRLGQHSAMGLDLAYQTSLAATASETPTLAAAHDTSMRSHRLEAGFTPRYRIGDGGLQVSLGAFAGYGIRAFSSVVALSTPRYMLHGPMVRAEIVLAILDGKLWLQVAPEAQLIIAVSEELRDSGRLENAGQSTGIEAVLGCDATSWLSIAVRYRGASATAKSALEKGLEDSERYILLDATYRM
jgi:hypothetical protein